jgi:hypothetical protein
MPNRPISPVARRALAVAVTLTLSATGAAHAQGVSVEEFAKVQTELARQAKLIAAQQLEIDALRAERDATLATIRAAGYRDPQAPLTRLAEVQPAPNAVTEAPPVKAISPTPEGPVGERPPEETKREIAAAIPPELGVLTPRGHLVIDPSIEYVRSSNNRLVFRGVEIVPGIQLGVIEASNVAQDTGVATIAARYGLTNRLEVEARVPYIVRDDRVTTLAQRDETLSRTTNLRGHDIGDIEFDARYQLNSGAQGGPIFVAISRVKPPTGTGPYDVHYDEFGVATTLPTGSGFWAVEGGLTVLYPSDPAILFAGLTYIHNFGRNIDKTVGSGNAAVHVGQVDPGIRSARHWASAWR